MRLLFLGTGAAHTLDADNFQSNMLLTAASGRRLLVDCGSDIRWSLHRAGLSHRDVDDIYVSHLHADHIGGLEYIAFQTKFDPQCRRPVLYLEQGLAEVIWERSLRGGLGVITEGETTLETFFEVRPLRVNRPFAWEGASLTPIPTLHVASPQRNVNSHALLIEHGEYAAFLTTDTQHNPELLLPYFRASMIVFHDCETGAVKTRIHAHYDELRRLPEDVRRKMWLYDYQSGALPDARADGFCGFVHRGQSFDLR